MKLYRLTLLFCAIASTLSAKAQFTLSDKSEISVVTIGPYQPEVYSAFGHSGFHVYDPEHNIDWFYNYGVYDFEQENFFVNFAKGLLKYRLSVSYYDRTVQYYKSQNRYIKEQYLSLTQEEKQRFFDMVQNNAKPENAEYFYNYVYNNCATKIRDVVSELFPEQIEYDLSYKREGITIRDLMDEYLTYQPWEDWIIDIGLGSEIDAEASAKEYMFLPDYIFYAFEKATIERNGVKQPLVLKTVEVFVPEEKDMKNGIFTPQSIFVLLFFVVGFITNRNFKTGIRTRWVDAVLFGLVGFVGWWVAFLWLRTEHLSQNNLNIFWAIPFHLPLAFFISKVKLKPFMKGYFKMVAYWYCLLLVVWAVLPQPLGVPLVPVVLTMVLRAFYIAYDLGKKS